jgi:hypothetical protein
MVKLSYRRLRDGAPLTELPEKVRKLFAKSVMAIHSRVKYHRQAWLKEKFSVSTDLLIRKNTVNTVLVGGADDVCCTRDAIASMSGKTSLADLPRLVMRCAMCVGQ